MNCLTYAGDVRAIRAAGSAQHVAGEVLNVGPGSQTPVNDALRLAAQFVGTELDVCDDATQPGEAKDASADTSRAREKRSYSPEVAFRDRPRAESDWLATIKVQAP